MSTQAQVVEADWTWLGDRFEAKIQVEILADGRFGRIGRLELIPTRRLCGQALLPGFVNGHSHAFQRGLRGRGETFPAGGGSFWSWRKAMYGLVQALDADGVYSLSRQAFSEMLDAGITTVAEFHYLRHRHASRLDFAFDDAVLAAAQASGIRLVLLLAYYQTGGIGQRLEGAQQRFATPDLATYWRAFDRLQSRLTSPLHTLGTVAHSIRAAPPETIATLWHETRDRGLVLHMHLEEQQREIDACVPHYGVRPVRLMIERLGDLRGVTAVHATHTTRDDLRDFLAAGGRLCVCPLTEGNLGDGVPSLAPLGTASERLCLGTDSNARIAMLEEMRWLEYGQRLRGGMRGAFRDATSRCAPALLEAATRGGARALGLDAGRIETGAWADLVVVDLEHPSLAGTRHEDLAAALVFGAADGALRAQAVGGCWRP